MVVNMGIIKSSKDWKEEPLFPKICKIIDTPHYTSPKSKYGSIPIITTSQCSSKGIDYDTADSTTYKEYERRKWSLFSRVECIHHIYVDADNAELIDEDRLTEYLRLRLANDVSFAPDCEPGQSDTPGALLMVGIDIMLIGS